MATQAIIISFRNASVFRNRRGSGDKALVDGQFVKRQDAPAIEIPEGELDARHVANMLHVLMGERPVPSLRGSWATPDPEIVSAAGGARFRIEEIASQETKNCRKAVADSWQTSRIRYRLKKGDTEVKGGLLYPARLRRYLGDELYSEFLALSDHFARLDGESNPTTHRRIEILSRHGESSEVRDFAAKCKSRQRTDLFNLISPEGNSESICLHQFRRDSWWNMLLVPSAPETVSRYNGTILVPAASPDFIERLNNGTGVATFLEGGFASLRGVESWSEALVAGTRPVQIHPTRSAHVS
jgi:hypothetical protein